MNSTPAQSEHFHAIKPDPTERDLSLGYKLSLVFHIAIFTLILVKSLVFPSSSILVAPVLRVDIVGLPDFLKKDKAQIPKGAAPDDLAEQLKQAEEQTVKPLVPAKAPPKVATKAPMEAAEPDEMVLKPTKSGQSQSEANRKTRENRMVNALSRIKSLSKISADDAPSPVVKGNRVSKGSSLSDEAREAGEASYYDALRSHLQDRWALPVWLTRQKLSAQIQLFIDSRGHIRNFKFVQTSGNPQFDDQVKHTLQQSQPYPIPPQAVAASLLSEGILVGFPL